jgi:hypothetical protein
VIGEQHALGDLIARGNTSDVWRWSPTTVVKVLRPEIPRDWAALEVDITRRVYEAGLPAPATDGVVEVDGRPGVVLEHIDGVSMWSQMKASPALLPRLIEELVDLQVMIHTAGPLTGLPDLTTRLHGKIDEAEHLPAHERDEAHGLLADMPTGESLCHGDMHPRRRSGSRYRRWGRASSPATDRRPWPLPPHQDRGPDVRRARCSLTTRSTARSSGSGNRWL